MIDYMKFDLVSEKIFGKFGKINIPNLKNIEISCDDASLGDITIYTQFEITESLLKVIEVLLGFGLTNKTYKSEYLVMDFGYVGQKWFDISLNEGRVYIKDCGFCSSIDWENLVKGDTLELEFYIHDQL